MRVLLEPQYLHTPLWVSVSPFSKRVGMNSIGGGWKVLYSRHLARGLDSMTTEVPFSPEYLAIALLSRQSSGSELKIWLEI